MARKAISAAKVRRIIKMNDDGYYQWAICDRVGVCQRTVQRVLLEHDRVALRASRIDGRTKRAVYRRIEQGMNNSQIHRVTGISGDAIQHLRMEMD